MRWSARTIILMGLGIGVAASGTTALWLYEHPTTSVPAWRHATDATAQGTPQDIETLGAEVARLKADKDQLAKLSGEMKSDLATLHSQLARVDRNQESTSQRLNQISDTTGRDSLDGSTVPAARDDKADGATLTPEEERERATARTQAEIDLLEGTLRAEKPDPAWATAAQLALHTTLHNGAFPGVQIVGAECRTTLCRMELALDVATAQDSFRNLIDLAPWSGQGLIQLNAETGLAVMYLAREEYKLPQVTE